MEALIKLKIKFQNHHSQTLRSHTLRHNMFSPAVVETSDGDEVLGVVGESDGNDVRLVKSQSTIEFLKLKVPDDGIGLCREQNMLRSDLLFHDSVIV